MITEDYVSFEVAKLLKEKGFNEECQQYYGDYKYPCPTLQMAMKWLREVHDLHIIAYPWKADKEEKATHWCCQVYKSFNLLGCEKYTDETPKSYEEACEAAIRHSLENLI